MAQTNVENIRNRQPGGDFALAQFIADHNRIAQNNFGNLNTAVQTTSATAIDAGDMALVDAGGIRHYFVNEGASQIAAATITGSTAADRLATMRTLAGLREMLV